VTLRATACPRATSAVGARCAPAVWAVARDAALYGDQRNDEDALTGAIIQLASQYGRYGYRRITALLRNAGWCIGRDRVQRIWRREGLKVSQKQWPRGRLWLNDGSCVRLRPEHEDHVWSSDSWRKSSREGVAPEATVSLCYSMRASISHA
jgi:hypothetical protein